LRGTSLCDSVFECTPSHAGTLCEEKGWLGKQVDFSLWYMVGIIDPISNCDEMMRLKDDYDRCILLQAIHNPFVETAIKTPYQNSHFIPTVYKVQNSASKSLKLQLSECLTSLMNRKHILLL
jgi:hypothetical protein